MVSDHDTCPGYDLTVKEKVLLIALAIAVVAIGYLGIRLIAYMATAM